MCGLRGRGEDGVGETTPPSAEGGSLVAWRGGITETAGGDNGGWQNRTAWLSRRVTHGAMGDFAREPVF